MTEAQMYQVFDEGGILSKGFSGYEYREGQLKMALGVCEAYGKDGILVVEAGTGIGKSFAYLVPALLNALERPDERTVIATSTINLQKQLFEKDIPMLFKLMHSECKVALAVGRGNYLCLRRFLAKRDESALLAQDPASDLARLGAWARTTESGLRSDYPYALGSDLWMEIASDGDLCQGFKCPYFRDCFYQKAKHHTKEAKIIVSNHHLLFSDVSWRNQNETDYEEDGILPGYQRLIIDEAHNIEENATSYFTATYDPKELKRQMTIIQHASSGRKSMLEQLAEYAPAPELADRILDDIAFLGGVVDTLDQYLVHLFSKTDYQPCLVTSDQQGRLQGFVEVAHPVWEAALRLSSKIDQFVASNNAPEELLFRLKELKVHGGRIKAMGQVLSLFCDFSTWKGDIHWFNPEMDRDRRWRIQIKITPLEIKPLLVEALFKKLDTVVCASATLSLGQSFQYWGSRVGLPYDDLRHFRSETYASPFDYRKNLLLLTPSDAPELDRDNPEPYIDYIAETVFQSILSSGGGALVLFTSYKMLKEVHKRIEERMKKAGLPLFRQGDRDRFSLLGAFIEDQDSSLMATSSFWEGVDAPGQTLRLVVIVKLPFQVPSDPVFKARCMAIDQNGGSGFMQIALPETTMKLKQGFGRLLRNKEDRGVVLVLDSRLLHKTYGIDMLHCLPESYHPDSTSRTISEHIENFLFGF